MKKPPQNLGPSQRQLRVGEQLRHIIAETLQRGHFRHPALIDHASDITVTEVRPAPDLKQAIVYVVALGGKSLTHILPALNEASSHFQKDINAKSSMKFTPRLTFKEDTSFDKAQRLEALFSNIEYSDQEDEADKHG